MRDTPNNQVSIKRNLPYHKPKDTKDCMRGSDEENKDCNDKTKGKGV